MNDKINCHFHLHTHTHTVDKKVSVSAEESIFNVVRTLFFDDGMDVKVLMREYEIVVGDGTRENTWFSDGMENAVEPANGHTGEETWCNECTENAVKLNDGVESAVKLNDVENAVELNDVGNAVEPNSNVESAVEPANNKTRTVKDLQKNTNKIFKDGKKNGGQAVITTQTKINDKQHEDSKESKKTTNSDVKHSTCNKKEHSPKYNHESTGSRVSGAQTRIAGAHQHTGSSAVLNSSVKNFLIRVPHQNDVLKVKIRQKNAHVPVPKKGLSNLGNTCYMNSALQCMIDLPLLTTFIRSNTFKGRLTNAYKELLAEYSSDSALVVPAEFRRSVVECTKRFYGNKEQDASEFLICVIERMCEEMKEDEHGARVSSAVQSGTDGMRQHANEFNLFRRNNDNIFTALFFSWLSSCLTCQTCRGVKEKGEAFLSLELPIPNETNYHPSVILTFRERRELVGGKLCVRRRRERAEERTLARNMRTHESRTFVKSIKIFVESTHTVKELLTRTAHKYKTAGLVAVSNAKPFSVLKDADLIAQHKEVFVFEYDPAREYVWIRLSVCSFVFYTCEIDVPFLVEVRRCDNGMIEGLFGEIMCYVDEEHSYGGDGTCRSDTCKECVGRDLNNNVVGGCRGDDSCREGDGIGGDHKEEDHKEGDCKDNDCKNNRKGNDCNNDCNTNDKNCNDNDKNYENSCKNSFNGKKDSNNNNYTPTPNTANITAPPSANDRFKKIYEYFTINFSPMNKLKLQNTVFPVANAHIKERRLAKLIGKNYNLRSRIYNEKRGSIKLEDCIDLFLSKEYLGLDNRLVCTYCERVTVHSKKYEIVFLPKYLIIQLKRFNFNGDYQRKIKTFVDYHSTLIINAVRYTLRSTCNHIEIGVGSGHYTAYFYGDRIVCANDSVVSEVKDVNRSNAYMLFYERVE